MSLLGATDLCYERRYRSSKVRKSRFLAREPSVCVSCVVIVQDIDTEPKRRCRGGFHDFRTVFKIQNGSFPATLRCSSRSVRLARETDSLVQHRLSRARPTLAQSKETDSPVQVGWQAGRGQAAWLS